MLNTIGRMSPRVSTTIVAALGGMSGPYARILTKAELVTEGANAWMYMVDYDEESFPPFIYIIDNEGICVFDRLFRCAEEAVSILETACAWMISAYGLCEREIEMRLALEGFNATDAGAKCTTTC